MDWHLHRYILALVFLVMSGYTTWVDADVVRPALIEITVDASGVCHIEIRASIEALLTGINAQYKNTQDSPMASAYDQLRKLTPQQLDKRWAIFQQRFIEQIQLRADGKRIPLMIVKTTIPPPGYTQVPRISVIVLEAKINPFANSLDWRYPKAFGDSVVRVRQVNTAQEKWHWSAWQWLKNGQRSTAFSLTEVFSQPHSIGQIVWTYLVLGFEHIVPKGLDHILFIVGIFLLSPRLRPLLWQVSMFTLAHTITLGLSVAGYIDWPSYIVEPLIALSIAYIGIENIVQKNLHTHRLLLVFVFGLLHGMGFAQILQEFGLPADAFLIALISFNVGVEIAQLAIILLGMLGVSIGLHNPSRYRQWVVIPGSLMITMIGLYWAYERLMPLIPLFI